MRRERSLRHGVHHEPRRFELSGETAEQLLRIERNGGIGVALTVDVAQEFGAKPHEILWIQWHQREPS